MIFYHYTFLENLGSIDGSEPGIIRDGLLPHRWDVFPHDHVKIPEVVWLTTQSIPTWWLDQGPDHLRAYCRIKVAIPATDRKLMSFERFLRVLGIDPFAIDWPTDGWRRHWIYCGKVGLSKFRLVEYADPARRAAAT